jgi:hypothetical protein
MVEQIRCLLFPARFRRTVDEAGRWPQDYARQSPIRDIALVV